MFVTLGTQHAMRMRHNVIRCLYGSIIFFHIISLMEGFSEEKKVIEQTMCVLIISITLSETFPILRRAQRNIIRNVHKSQCEVHVITVRF